MSNDILTTIGVAAITSFLTTSIGLYLKRVYDKDGEERKKLEDRLNPDLNVVREYEEIVAKGIGQNKTWSVNPFWITYVDDEPRIRTWERHSLREYRLGPSRHNPTELCSLGLVLLPDSIERAKQKREWLVMNEVANTLTLRGYKPCQAGHRDLFQEPPPEPKKKVVKQ